MNLPYLVRIILPLIILQSIHYKLFNNELLIGFLEFSNPFFIQIYTLFMAIRAINALLILANHKPKRSYFQLILLSFIELILLVVAYNAVKSWAIFSDIGHLSTITPVNFYLIFFFQLSLTILGILLWKKETENTHMNFIVKTGFYFVIPFVFWFTLSKSNNRFSVKQCLNILSQTEVNDYKKIIEKSGLIGRDITTIKSLNNHTYVPSKKYILYLMDSQCKTCWRALENVKKFKNESEIEDVILFDLGDPKNRADILNAFTLSENFTVYDLDWDILKHIGSVPAMVTIDNMKIKNIYVKDIPCTYEMNTLFESTNLISQTN